MTMFVSCVFLFKLIVAAVLLFFLSVLSINCNKSSVGGFNSLTFTAIQTMNVANDKTEDNIKVTNNSYTKRPFIMSFYHPKNGTMQYEKSKCTKQLHTIQNSIIETYINELLSLPNTTSTTATPSKGDSAATTSTSTITIKQAYEIVMDSIDLTLRRNQIDARTTVDTKANPATRHRQLRDCKPWICLHQHIYCNGKDSLMSNPCCLLPSCNFLLTTDQRHEGLETNDLTILSKVQKDDTGIVHDDNPMIVDPVVFTSSGTTTIQRIRKRRDHTLQNQHHYRQLFGQQQQSEQQKHVYCNRTICKQNNFEKIIDMGCCTYCGLKDCINVISKMNASVLPTVTSTDGEEIVVVATTRKKNKSISDSVVVPSNVTTQSQSQSQKQKQALRVIVGNIKSMNQQKEEEELEQELLQLQKNGNTSSGGFQTVSEFYKNIDKLLQHTDPCVDHLKAMSFEIIYFS